MTDYIRGQRVRITKPEASADAELLGETGTIRHRRRGAILDQPYTIRLDSTQAGVLLYADEFEPLGAVLTRPRDGDTVTVNGKTWDIITSNQHAEHIRVSPDLIVEWEILVALGFTLDERETTEEAGA